MKVFISYAGVDIESFNIPSIADFLEKQEDIERVYYWDRDCDAEKSIISYMEESIRSSDRVVCICSENSKDSGPVRQELEMAVYLNKTIIPVFQNIADVTLSLKPKRGVKFERNYFSNFLEQLYFVLTGKKPLFKELTVFFSYDSADASNYKMTKIIRRLEMYSDVKKIIFWKGDRLEDWMEQLRLCDIFVVFCSKNYKSSVAVSGEWSAAYQHEDIKLTKIVPVYENESHVPLLLKQHIGVKFNRNKFDEFIENLYIRIKS